MARADDEAPEGGGFLSRWSRRKRAADAAPDDALRPDAPEAAPEPLVEPAPLAEPVLSDDELAALPRIEDLTAGSDLSPFLRPGVPRALKNAAMRKMWMLTPAIRDHADPAVDYAWDWNTPGGVPGDGCAPSLEAAKRMLKDLTRPAKESVDEAGADGGGADGGGADLDAGALSDADAFVAPESAAESAERPADPLMSSEAPEPDEIAAPAVERPIAEGRTSGGRSAPVESTPRRHGRAIPT